MDPVAHTFVGAALAGAGLRRTTPMATATLVLAANAPDIDIAAQAFGPYAALAWRRGITHGVPALIVLPFVVAGAVLLWDRQIRRRRHPARDPAIPSRLLGLAAIGVATHPILDWLNTYGMRWWLPIDGRWSYGDAVFIVDPWLWLVLGGSLFLLHSRGAVSRGLWAILALLMSGLMVGLEVVPLIAKGLWLLGVSGWIVLRARGKGGPDGGAAARGEVAEMRVRAALLATAVYLLVMTLQTSVAERITRSAAREAGLGEVQDLMVGPVPANPFRSEVILQVADGLYRGHFSWLRTPRVELDRGPLPDHPRDAVVRAAETAPAARDYLVWARFPLVEVREAADGWIVEFHDARYSARAGAGSLSGVRVELDREMRPRSAPR